MSKGLAPATMFPMMARPATAGQRRVTTGEHFVAQSNTADESDEALVARVTRGDQRAFTMIVRRHGGRLRALALRFAGGSSEADDIVQEAFLSFWKTADRWQPGGPPLAAYLTRITLNRAIDGDRRRKLRRFFGLEYAAEVADPAVAADEQLSSKNDLAAVTDLLRHLPARQRAAILLAAGSESTNNEIGTILGLSVGAVEQLLVRARRTLRTRLAQKDASVESEGQ